MRGDSHSDPGSIGRFGAYCRNPIWCQHSARGERGRGARRLGGGRWLSQQRLGRAPTGSRPPRAERDEGGEPMAPPTALNATGTSSTAPTAVGLATVQAIDNSSHSSMQGSCGLIKWCNSMLHLADRLTRQTQLGVHAETLVLTNAAESVRSMCPTPARLRPLRVVPLDQAMASAIRGWSDMLNFSRYDWKRRLPVSCCQLCPCPGTCNRLCSIQQR